MKDTMKQIFFLIGTLFIGLSDLHSQEIKVNASTGSDSLLIGSQMDFSLGINAPGGSGIILDGPGEEIGEGFEILDRTIDSARTGDNLAITYHYLITSFDSGTHSIPSYSFVVRNSAGEQMFPTDSLEITVYSPPVDTTADIRDVKALINTPVSFREMLPYGISGLGLLLVAIFVILLVRRLRGKEPVRLKKELVVPPHVIALQTLDYLKKEKIWQKGRVKEYYIILSDTIRKYVEDQFGIDSMESTTDETLQKFRRFAYDDSLLLEMLESLLNLSDLVKFAKEDPSPSENETNLTNAYLFVEKTRPAETVAKKNEEN